LLNPPRKKFLGTSLTAAQICSFCVIWQWLVSFTPRPLSYRARQQRRQPNRWAASGSLHSEKVAKWIHQWWHST